MKRLNLSDKIVLNKHKDEENMKISEGETAEGNSG